MGLTAVLVKLVEKGSGRERHSALVDAEAFEVEVTESQTFQMFR